MEDGVAVGAKEHPSQNHRGDYEQAAKLDAALPIVSGGVFMARLQAAACHKTFICGNATRYSSRPAWCEMMK